jgi:hypothetical protein
MTSLSDPQTGDSLPWLLVNEKSSTQSQATSTGTYVLPSRQDLTSADVADTTPLIVLGQVGNSFPLGGPTALESRPY